MKKILTFLLLTYSMGFVIIFLVGNNSPSFDDLKDALTLAAIWPGLLISLIFN